MKNKCIACGMKDFSVFGEQLITCENCGLVGMDTIPSVKFLNKLYQQDYFFGKEYSDYKADRLALEANFNKRKKFLKKYLTKDSRVAEIGCAYGYFLNLIKDSVSFSIGYDVSEDGVSYAKNDLNVNAVCGDFLSTKAIPEFDLVVMWDVVEHVPNPDRFIEHASKSLKTGGALAFTTGDVDALNARLRGMKWRMVHPPTHIFYFNKKSVEYILDKNGLEMISFKHRATYRNVGSVINQLIVNREGLNKSSAIFQYALLFATKTGLARLNFPLNLFDIMEVVAVKK